MLKSFDVVVLNRARATFQRISDAKFFNGWIRNITPDVVVVHTCTSCRVEPGDEFAFQVYGNKKDAFFHAELIAVQGAEQIPVFGSDRVVLSSIELGCHITTEMTFKDGQGQPRFFVEGVTADVRRDDEVVSLASTVIDIGPGGFAMISDGFLRKGEIVDVSVFAKGQLIQCRVEVRNCVVNALNHQFHRVGFQIQQMDRVDSLRWKQLYMDILDSNRMQAALKTAEVGTVVKLKSKDAA